MFPLWLLRESCALVFVIGRHPTFSSISQQDLRVLLGGAHGRAESGLLHRRWLQITKGRFRPRSYRSIYLLPSVWEKVTVVCLPEFSSGSCNRCMCNGRVMVCLCVLKGTGLWSALCSGFFGFPGLSPLSWQAGAASLFSCLTRRVFQRRVWVRERRGPEPLLNFTSSESELLGAATSRC